MWNPRCQFVDPNCAAEHAQYWTWCKLATVWMHRCLLHLPVFPSDCLMYVVNKESYDIWSHGDQSLYSPTKRLRSASGKQCYLCGDVLQRSPDRCLLTCCQVLMLRQCVLYTCRHRLSSDFGDSIHGLHGEARSKVDDDSLYDDVGKSHPARRSRLWSCFGGWRMLCHVSRSAPGRASSTSDL